MPLSNGHHPLPGPAYKCPCVPWGGTTYRRSLRISGKNRGGPPIWWPTGPAWPWVGLHSLLGRRSMPWVWTGHKSLRGRMPLGGGSLCLSLASRGSRLPHSTPPYLKHSPPVNVRIEVARAREPTRVYPDRQKKRKHGHTMTIKHCHSKKN